MLLRLISASGAYEGGSAGRKVQLSVKGRVGGGEREVGEGGWGSEAGRDEG